MREIPREDLVEALVVFQSINCGMMRACGVSLNQVGVRLVCAVSGHMCERGGQCVFVSKMLSDWALGRRNAPKPSCFSATNEVVVCRIELVTFCCCLRRVSGWCVQSSGRMCGRGGNVFL